MLLPHLGGEAYTIRSAIVSVMASVLVAIEKERKAAQEEGADLAPTTSQALSRTRTVQHLLDTLMAR